ncbi:hypothetical protein CI088_01435 [Enterococcus plantarum]|uniref:Uncharacterized protein n=1 Tax=Enterococcus plantarum TaxID=1077675 RepID=A0A2W3ZJJ3_9ENTE|nr:hypothetical protein CI088_01435 [Enterococcus plantarum]
MERNFTLRFLTWIYKPYKINVSKFNYENLLIFKRLSLGTMERNFTVGAKTRTIKRAIYLFLDK